MTTAFEIKTATNQKTWDHFITSHKEANFLHAWAWGDFHLARHKIVLRRIAVDQDQRILGAYVGQIEDAKRGRYLAIAGGPILDWQNQALVKAMFNDIKQLAKKYHCVFVRIRPQLTDTKAHRQLFKSLGLSPAPIYLSVEYAGILDLTKSEAEIKAGAAQRLRRSLKKALKNNIEISVSTDVEDIHTFYQIQLETAKRHDFVSFKEDFLKKQFLAFQKYGQVKLYIAKKDGQILAENFMLFYGNEASYHYGVSSYLGTKYSSAPLLHFAAMRDARALGIQRYNFWGITAEDDTKHRFYGVSQFKRGFGVQELKYLHAHDLVISPMRYFPDFVFEKLRARLRHV